MRLRPAVIFGLRRHRRLPALHLRDPLQLHRRGPPGLWQGDHHYTVLDHSVQVEDHGRGIPVDYNNKERRYNWELVFCEMYAGGKYNNDSGESYEYSLGLNGLGLCATQYASEYMDVDIRRDGCRYTLHFERGENVGGLQKEPYAKKGTGSLIKWKPDLQVFTDIDVSLDYYLGHLKAPGRGQRQGSPST